MYLMYLCEYSLVTLVNSMCDVFVIVLILFLHSSYLRFNKQRYMIEGCKPANIYYIRSGAEALVDVHLMVSVMSKQVVIN